MHHGLHDKFFQGDDELADKYWEWIKPEPGQRENVFGLNLQTMEYIERILEE